MSKRKIRKKIKSDKVEVPMSSMIDVVFLLLIYFIVTQKPIIEDTLLGVSLPAPSQSKSTDTPPPMMTIDVMRLVGYPADTYHVNGSPCPLKSIKSVMKSWDAEQTLLIRCGPNAKHQKLIKILDACSEAEITNLNIIDDPTVAFDPSLK